MSSQFNEHEEIVRYFNGHVGHFLDIGAHDGITYSNTRPLAELGWTGVCVEPSPASFFRLMKNYKWNAKIELVNAGLVPHVGREKLAQFWVNTDGQSAEAMSTFVPQHRDKFIEHHPYQAILIPQVSVANLLNVVGRKFDFINVDVEGLNVEVLEALWQDGAYARALCIECDPESKVEAMERIMVNMGLTGFQRIGGNLLGMRQ